MAKSMLVKLQTGLAVFALVMSACSQNQLLETEPDYLTDTSDVVITCDTRQGNKGLLDYDGNVYVHLGLITSKSEHNNDWRYVKFRWGSRDDLARALPCGKNKWTYTIKNIREFFNVDPEEQIMKLAILYRSGACIDIYCKVLRNADGSDLYIPIHDQSAPEAQLHDTLTSDEM